MSKSKAKRTPRRRWKILITIILLLLLAFLGMVFGQQWLNDWLADDPFTPPCNLPHLEVVYEDELDGIRHLYQVRANGDLAEMILEGHLPTWTPSLDGHSLFMQYSYDEYGTEPYLLDSQSDEIQLLSPHSIHSSEFSADGKSLFMAGRSETTSPLVFELLRVPLPYNGKVESLLQSPTQHFTVVRASPDGKYVSFFDSERMQIVSQVGEIITIPDVNLDYFPRRFTWTADSQSVFFILSDKEGISLYRFDIGTDQSVHYVATLQGTPSDDLVVSPDGTIIAYRFSNDIVILDAITGETLWHIADASSEYDAIYQFIGWIDSQTLILSKSFHPVGSGMILQDKPTILYHADVEQKQLDIIAELDRSNQLQFFRWLPEAKALVYGLGQQAENQQIVTPVYIWTAEPIILLLRSGI